MTLAERRRARTRQLVPGYVYKWNEVCGSELVGALQDAEDILEPRLLTKESFDHFVLKMIVAAGGWSFPDKNNRARRIEVSKPVVFNNHAYVFRRVLKGSSVASGLIIYPRSVNLPKDTPRGTASYEYAEFGYLNGTNRPIKYVAHTDKPASSPANHNHARFLTTAHELHQACRLTIRAVRESQA